MPTKTTAFLCCIAALVVGVLSTLSRVDDRVDRDVLQATDQVPEGPAGSELLHGHGHVPPAGRDAGVSTMTCALVMRCGL